MKMTIGIARSAKDFSINWTDADTEAAVAEGWMIFDASSDAPTIQRDDEAAVFHSDEAAERYVRSAATSHGFKALRIVAIAKAKQTGGLALVLANGLPRCMRSFPSKKPAAIFYGGDLHSREDIIEAMHAAGKSWDDVLVPIGG